MQLQQSMKIENLESFDFELSTFLFKTLKLFSQPDFLVFETKFLVYEKYEEILEIKVSWMTGKEVLQMIAFLSFFMGLQERWGHTKNEQEN